VRISWFGDEPELDQSPGDILKLAIETAATEASRRFEELHLLPTRTNRASAVGNPNAELDNIATELTDPLRTLPADIRRGLQESESVSESALRVVLMGRTLAGKSTLLEALSQGDGSRIGDGRQRASRDVCEREVVELPGVVFVDVPGVGAADGLEDFEVAFAEVPRADVILWVAANEPPQEDTAMALRLLAALGKPILVALNCRMDLSHQAKLDDFVEAPEMAFEESAKHLAMLERHLARVGSSSVRTVVVHADAAYRATHRCPDQQALRHNSGIEDLLSQLRDQRDHASDQRRAIRRVDAVRTPILQSLATLDVCASAFKSSIEVERGVSLDLRQRLNRVLDSAAEQLIVEVTQVIARRRRWHLTADPSNGIEARWSDEAKVILAELNKVMTASSKRLAEDLASASEQVRSDWECLPQASLDVSGLTGFGSVWMNRLTRAGVGAGVSLAAVAVGAKVGAAVGAPGGPVVMAITAVVGAVLGLAATPIVNFFDKTFRGEAYVLNKRRTEFAEKLRPILDKAEVDAISSAKALVGAYRDGVNDFITRLNETLQSQDRTLEHWLRTGKNCLGLIRVLDAATACALLALVGRVRCAANVTRAHRSAGIAVVVELPEPTFSELALFPALGLVEQLVPAPPAHTEAPAGSAVHLMVGLAPHAKLTKLRPDSAIFQVQPNSTHPGRLSAWSELLSTFTSSEISIIAGPSGSHDQAKDLQ